MSFVYKGVSSDTMKFNVTSRQVYNAPAYDLNAIEVPGRSGDLLNPQNRFKNKQVSYTGFLKASDFEGSTWREKLSTGLIQLKGWLCSDAGQYHELTDDYDPGFTRYGYISGETAISDIEDRPFGVTLTVTFNVKPYMYKAGEPMELPETKSASGSIITITDGAENTPLKSAVVNIEPVQSGSGDPSPTNIRPISGWTQAVVTRTRKNLFPYKDIESQTKNGVTITIEKSNGAITNIHMQGTATTAFPVPFYVNGEDNQWVLPKGECKLYIGGDKPTQSRTFDINVRKAGTTSDITAGSGVITITLSEQTVFGSAYIWIYSGAVLNHNIIPVIVRSGVDTSVKYPITQRQIINISLGQTVYGGTLDVVKGKLNVKPYYASYSGQTLVGPWISSHDKYVAGATPTTGAQVVDMGAAGTDYDVTPQAIKTLLGVNNIWADAGGMEIEYPVPTENPYPFGSRPLYEITMDGTGTLAVNGREWTISDYTGTLYCDTEAMEWYDASQLRNNIVSGDGWPVFEAGENSVSYTGDITKVMVTPRWRTL